MSEQEHTLVSKESINTFREVLERYDILFSDISWDAMSFVLRHFLWRNVQRHPALYQDMFNEDDVVQVFEDRILTSLDVLYANDRLPIHSDDEYDKIVQLVETLFAKDGDNVVDAIHVLLDALTGDGSLDDGAVHTQFVTDNPDVMSVAPSLVDDDDDGDAQPVTDEPSDETPERPRDQWADVSVDVDASQDKRETIEPEIINPADISVVLDDAIDDDGGSDDDSDDDIPDIVVGASLSEPEPVIESVVQEPVQEPVTVHTLSMPATPQVPTMHRANMPSSAPSTSLSYDAQPVHRGRHAAPIVNDNTSKHVDVNKTASDAGLDIDGTAHASVNERAVRDNVDDYASFVKLLADRKIDEALALARATNRADMLQMIELVRGEERERQAAKHYDDVKSIVSDVTADVLADTKDPHVEAMLDAKTQDGDAKTGRDGDSEQLAGTFGFQSTIDMLDDDDDDDDDDDLNIGLYTGASSIIDMDDDDEPDDVMSQPMNEPDDALVDDKTVSVDEPALDVDAFGSTGDIDGVSDVMPDDDADDAGDDDDDTADDDDIIVEPSAGMDEQARLGVQHSDVQSDMHNAVVVSDVSHVIDVEPVAQVGESNSDDGKSDDADGGDAGNDKNDSNDVDAQHERIEGDDMDGHDTDAQHVVQDMPRHDKREVAPSDDDNFVNEFDTLLYEDDLVHSPITTLIDAVDGVRDDDTSKQASVDASNGDISNDVFADDTPDDINDEPLDDAPVDDVSDDIPDTVPDDIPDDIPEDMPNDIDADLPPVQHDGDDDDDFDDTDGTDNPDDTDDADGDDDMPQDGTPDAQSDDDVPFGQDEPSDDKEDDDDDDDSAGVDDIPQTTPASTDASHDASVHDEPDVDADGHDDEHDDVDTPSQVASQLQQTVVTDTTQLELEPVAAPVGYKDTDAVVHQQNMLDILAGLDIDLSNTGHVSVGPFAGTDNKLDKASTVKNPRSVLAKPRRSDSDSDSDTGSNGNNDGNGGRQVSPETLARFKRRNNNSGTGGRSLARNSDAAAGNANVQQATAQNNVDPQYDDDAVF